MILEILTYPNKKLFVKSLEVKVFDEELHKFLDAGRAFRRYV